MVIRLLVFFQEATFADALATRLDAEQDIEVVAALYMRAPSPRLFTGVRADVVPLDGDLPGDSAVALREELCQRGKAPYVIVLSYSSDPMRIVSAAGAGAVGWVRKDESLDRLIAVIHGVARGETWLPPGGTGQVLQLLLRRPDPEHHSDDQLLAPLIGRERVLAYLARGTARRDMTERLHVSPNTVRTHLQNLMVKLGVHSALEAVALTRSQLDS